MSLALAFRTTAVRDRRAQRRHAGARSLDEGKLMTHTQNQRPVLAIAMLTLNVGLLVLAMFAN
jgi:hypothetical protein